jgi:hypothetical protein
MHLFRIIRFLRFLRMAALVKNVSLYSGVISESESQHTRCTHRVLRAAGGWRCPLDPPETQRQAAHES